MNHVFDGWTLSVIWAGIVAAWQFYALLAFLIVVGVLSPDTKPPRRKRAARRG